MLPCFLFVVSLGSLIHVAEVAIIVVSHSTGNDSSDCLPSPESVTPHTVHPPCATLDYALENIHSMRYNNVSVLLSASDDNYSLDSNRSVTAYEGMLLFELIGYQGVVNIMCSEETGFAFRNSSNVRFVNVTISGCGLLQNSSSSASELEQENSSMEMKYKQFFVAIYFLLCSDITFDHVNVSETPGVAVVFYSIGGTNVITTSSFYNNNPDIVGSVADNAYDILQGGGGIAIEFLYCIPGSANCSSSNGSYIPQRNYQDITFKITYCKFFQNVGKSSTNTNSTDAFIIPNKNHNVALGRGGGLGAVFKGNANNISLTIDKCEFRDNKALWGGGALFEFQDNSQNNVLMVKSTNFTGNKCHYSACNYTGTGGGGVRVLFAGFDSLVKNNSVIFSDVKFEKNKAYFGGGTSIMTFPEIEQTTNNVFFTDSVWISNVARIGSAVDLSVWHLTFNGSVIRPIFSNTTFESNSINYTSRIGIAGGAGTIYADTVPVAFSDNVNFTNNIGTCIYVVEADAEFLDNSSAVFDGNMADIGAGISLHGNSYMELYNGSNLTFINNTAKLYGGAINWHATGNRFLVSTRNCFIRYKQYFVAPEKWPVSLKFANNTAGVTGNDIFGTTLLGCLWGGQPYGDFINNGYEYRKVFNWSSSIWSYTDSNLEEAIATDPGHFIGENIYDVKCGGITDGYMFPVVPGGHVNFDIKMSNDKYSLTPSDALIFAAVEMTVNNETNSTNSVHSVQYLSPSVNVLLNGTENEQKVFDIFTLYPRVIGSKVTLKFIECPLGFIQSKDTGKCVGGNYLYIRTHANFSISLQKGYWIGKVNNTTVTSQCFFCPFRKYNTFSNYILLSFNDSSPSTQGSEVTEKICGDLNRIGNLCYKCKNGFAPAITSEDYSCVKCDKNTQRYSWIIYIIRKFLPVTIVLLLVVVLRISVTLGPTNSFVLFAQVISTTFAVDAGQTLDYSLITHGSSANYVRKTYITIYSLWNLDFFESVGIWPICLGSNITALHLLSFKFVTAFYPLVVLAVVSALIMLYNRGNRVFVCLLRPLHRVFARCVRAFDINRSIMDAFATFLVLSYVKFAVTSAWLLFPSQLLGENGKLVETVSYFDPSIHYWSKGYAPYLLVSLFVCFFVCFCLPAILFLYSIRPFYTFLDNHRRLQFLLPGEKFKHFLNSFYHCYKDGRDGEHDRRYFCSFYFFARLLLILSYTSAKNWVIQLIMQQAVCTFIIAVVSIFQPYKDHVYNIVDTIMFTILAIINALTLYQVQLASENSELSLLCYCIQLIFLSVPMLYITAIFFKHVVVKSFQRLCRCQQSRRTDLENEVVDFSFGQFMHDVEDEGRFERISPYTPPVSEDQSSTGDSSAEGTIGRQNISVNAVSRSVQRERKHVSVNSGLRRKQRKQLPRIRGTTPASHRIRDSSTLEESTPLLH